MTITCKHCRKTVTTPHRCPVAARTFEHSDTADFVGSVVSAAVDELLDNGSSSIIGSAIDAVGSLFDD